MKNRTHIRAVLLAFGTWAVPVRAQGHYKSFIVSTYVIQGNAQGLMNGNPDPAQSWSRGDVHTSPLPHLIYCARISMPVISGFSTFGVKPMTS
jgi:hypothetical protein